MMMIIIMIVHECICDTFWEGISRSGRERKGHRVVKRMEAYCIYTYEDRIMKPTKTLFLNGGDGNIMKSVNLFKIHSTHI
jgi:hypothetical protein